ncbi:four-carbon acid sugar kinase family protein [Ruegeria sp. HKCCD8929]|uniref:four-carbon acid sugar kinase family protein n=1 Tax=Ruegeria sp. HKCCD8929 TaxID=2683006 RepID=UPI001489BF34|nr:four-carbon acid sugar kinase family protein [Ruegeria sp. HKCCD8929]
MRVGLIADDLTGLAAVASEFERYGFTVGIAMNASAAAALADCYDIVGIDTNSRALPPEIAAQKACQAAEALAALHPDWLFKQGDSALHGHIAAELSAIAVALNAKNVLMAPACPSMGRLTVNGFHNTVAKDPQTHVRVVDLWSGDTTVAVADSTGPAPVSPGRPLINVADAKNDAALDIAVRRADAADQRLVAGSVGLAKAIARHLWATATQNAAPALILLGSFQARSRLQAETLLATGTARMIDLPTTGEVDDVRANLREVGQVLSDGYHVVLAASPSAVNPTDPAGYPFLDGVVRAGIEDALRQTTRAIFDEYRNLMCGLIVAGGTTAGIVTRDVLEVTAMHRVEHLDDGVAAGLAEDGEGRFLPLVTKAGNWGETEVLLRAIRWLQQTHSAHKAETKE